MSANLRPYKDLFPQIGQRVMIDATSVAIGDVRMADDVSIWPLVAIRGDVNYVAIGARTNIQDGSVLHVTHKSSSNPEGNPLIIGEEVTVGHKVMLHGCTIEDACLIGMSTVLSSMIFYSVTLITTVVIIYRLPAVHGIPGLTDMCRACLAEGFYLCRRSTGRIYSGYHTNENQRK